MAQIRISKEELQSILTDLGISVIENNYSKAFINQVQLIQLYHKLNASIAAHLRFAIQNQDLEEGQ
jgi:hypothetical protein